MAQVPTYGGPQVRTAALQPTMQREVDVSSGTRALGQALGQVADLTDKVVRRDAEAEANSVDNEITAGWLQWDAENRRKYQGQNVGEYEVEAAKWWDKARETYGQKLSPLAQQAIGQQLARKRTQALGSVQGYVSAEKDRFADQAGESAAMSAIEFGVDTGDTAGAALQVRKIVAERGARKGWTTEMVQADQQRLLGTLHLSAITTMAERDPAKARAYYEQNKGEIPAQAQARVEQVLKAEGDNQFATQFAAQQATKPLAEQIAAAGEITDPERREKALTQIRNNHALVKAAQAEREQAASDEAWQMLGQGRRVPETVLMQMNGRERVQLQDYLRERAKQAASGKPVQTDFAVWYELSNRIAAGDKVDLRPYATKISENDLQALTAKQQAFGTPAKQDSMLTDKQRVDNAVLGLGIDPKRDPQSVYALETEIDRRVRAESAAKGGKELTADEKQKVIDSVVMDKVYVDEFGRDPQKPLAMLKPDEMADAYVVVDGKQVKVSSVPMNDRQQIIAALRANGRPVTEQNIVSLYMRAQRKPAASGKVQ